MIGFAILLLFLINRKDVEADLVGFFPFQQTTEPKNPKPQTSRKSVFRFYEISNFLSEVHGKSQIARGNRVNINILKEKPSPKPSVMFLSP